MDHRSPGSKIFLPVGLLRDGSHDRIGCYGGEDQVQGLHRLQHHNLRYHLSHIWALDMGRRMACRTWHVGFCRIDRCPFGGRLAGPGWRHPAWTEDRKICRRRDREADPWTQHTFGCPGSIHPLVRLVRIQCGQYYGSSY